MVEKRKTAPTPAPSALKRSRADKENERPRKRVSFSNVESQSPIIVLAYPNTITTPLLQAAGFIVNTICRILICSACQEVVDPDNFRTHVVQNHKSLAAPADLQRKFDKDVIPHVQPFATFPVHSPVSPIEQIYGLEAPKLDYMICKECNHGYMSSKTFNQHPCVQTGYIPHHFVSAVQRFSKHPRHSWFPVTLLESNPQPPLTRWEAFQEQMKALPPCSADASNTDNYRVLRQILHKERWIEHVRGKDLAKLKELVSFSVKNQPLGSLVRHIHAYLAHVQARLTDKYIRRLIGTRPATEHERTFAIHHSDVGWDTHRKYAYVMAAALSLLLNNVKNASPDYSFHVPLDVSSLSESLWDALSVEQKEDEPEEVPMEDEVEVEELEEEEEEEEDEPEVTNDNEESGAPHSGTYYAYSPSETRPPPKTAAKIQNALHALLIALFSQKADNNDQFFSPFIRYLVLASVNANGEWQAAGRITQKIAAILFIGRLVFAQELLFTKMENTSFNTSTAYDLAVKPWLREDSESVMPMLYILLRCFLSMRSADDSMLVFNAPDLSGQSAMVGQHELHVHAIGDALRELVQEITRDLDELLFQQSEFDMPEDLFIHDEPRSKEPGYSFASDARNRWSSGDAKTLVHHVLITDHLYRRFCFQTQQGRMLWQSVACLDQMRQIYNIQERLSIAIMLSSGQPARGTELASLLYANIPGGSIRNVFVLFNMLLLRGSYNKTSFATGRDKTMVRVPLIEIGRQLIRFLVFVRPLYTIWQRHFRPRMESNARHFLFAGLDRPVTSEDLSFALRQYSLKRFNIPLRLSLFRQYMAFITACNEPLFASVDSTKGTTSAQEQFGHTGQMDRTHYGSDERIPAGMDRYTFMATAAVSGVFHLLFGHEPRVLRMLEKGNSVRVQHLATIQGIRQPVPSLFPPISQQPHVTAASMDTAALVITNRLLPPLVNHLNRSVAHAHAAVVDLFCPLKIKDVQLAHVAKHCTHPAIVRKLQAFLGKTLNGFKNAEQAMVTQLMYEGKEHILYVSPTGSGKTLPGLLNATLMDEGRATLWILPLQSMHHHYQRQCANFNISCETWTPRSSASIPKANVLVTVELTQLPQFKDYVANLRAKDRLARIIVDEIHLILTHSAFRSVMDSLAWIGAAGSQIVLQTATLPPVLQERLLKAVGITTCQVVRTKTCRPNISMHVIKCKSELLQNVVKECFAKALAYSTEGRVIIFCRSKAKAEEMAGLLQIPVCHSGMDPKQVDATLNELFWGTKRAVASTTLLGVAVDIPQVTHVIHVERPYDIISYAQEAGRGGRDSARSPAWSYIILPQGLSKTKEEDGDQDVFGRQALEEILQDDHTCRRLAMQVFLDGTAEPCSMMNGIAHLCDVCTAQSSNMPDRRTSSAFPWTSVDRVLQSLPLGPRPSPPELHSYYSSNPPPPSSVHLQTATAHASHHQPAAKPPNDVSRQLKTAHHLLDRLALTCVTCWLGRFKGVGYNHLSADCPVSDKDAQWVQWREVMKKKCAGMKGVCYSCACPQDLSYIDDRQQKIYYHRYGSTAANCRYGQVLLPMAFAVETRSDLTQEFLASSLRGGVPMDYPPNPFKNWIWEQGGGIPNIIKTLLLFSQTRHLP